MIVTAILAYMFAKEINNESNECRKLGGFLVHGNGVSLCIKIENPANE